ncbi:MAG TPA: phospholipase D-like domain-containing protein [Methanospirillum sp.]|nr:phospholipase D-like domain-containing protein [Methanospirillum sp.]
MLCLLFVPVSGWFQITEVYPDSFLKGDPDEYLVLSGTGDLTDIEIGDGEGSLSFPTGAQSGGSVIIARDAEAYKGFFGSCPDYELVGKDPSVPDMIASGRFQLANAKDELYLTLKGQTLQNLSWPSVFRPRKGQIHLIGPDGKWDERVLMAGASRFQPETYNQVSGTAFVSPDCSRAMLEDVIRSSRIELLVNIYEFTDPGFTDLICEASGRGVRVSVLIEGGPVGGITPEELAVIARLGSAGIPVFAMAGTGEDHAPYRFNHAKYIVIDGERLFLTTENFKAHSFPPKGLAGNRGWGVILSSRDLAGYFSRVFHEDMNGPGVREVEGKDGVIPPYSAEPYRVSFAPIQVTAESVTPVLAPDTTGLILPLIQNTSRRLWIEEAYIKHWSGGKKNPYLEAAVEAARRGVDVRILLDSYYYNTEDEADNDEIVREITGIATRENIPLQARMVDLDNTGLLKIHAKGVIADDSVFISSINWNENSPVFNREAGLIIRGSAITSYFASVFERDWQGVRATSSESRRGYDYGKITAVAGVILFLLVLSWWRHRQ